MLKKMRITDTSALVFALCALLTLCCAFPVNAAGTFDLLRIDTTPRGAALGGFPVGLRSAELSGTIANPATGAFLENRQTALSYAKHQLDMYSGVIQYGQTFGDGFASTGITYFSYGEFDRFSNTSDLGEGTYQAGDYMFDVAYSRFLPVEGMSAGARLKLIHSSIDEFTSQGIAFDLGWFWETGLNGFDGGLVLRNLGGQIQQYDNVAESLPAQAQLGIAKQLAHLPLQLSGGVLLEGNDGTTSLLSGDLDNLILLFSGEFTVSEFLQLRAGYTTLADDYRVEGSSDSIAGISAGLGLNYSGYRFDYGLQSMGELGYVHRFGVSFGF
ncbi:PorV/PorQ family protein [bacterium]|nr:PorV/PorQ family protein [bacterium]